MEKEKELTWNEIRLKKPEDYLTEKEYGVYVSALGDFNEMLKNTKPNKIKKFADSGLGLSAMRFARQFANPHEQQNLYKAVYAIVMDYQYLSDK